MLKVAEASPCGKVVTPLTPEVGRRLNAYEEGATRVAAACLPHAQHLRLHASRAANEARNLAEADLETPKCAQRSSERGRQLTSWVRQPPSCRSRASRRRPAGAARRPRPRPASPLPSAAVLAPRTGSPGRFEHGQLVARGFPLGISPYPTIMLGHPRASGGAMHDVPKCRAHPCQSADSAR